MTPARLAGKVVLVTGAGQAPGRQFAVRLAREGAGVIALDEGAPGPTGHPDLSSTVAVVESLGGRIVARDVDVRDPRALDAAVAVAAGRLGGLDAVVTSPVVTAPGSVEGIADEVWHCTLDRVLTGVWNTCRAALPHMADGGSITVVSSAAGLRGFAHLAHQAAAEHGVVGLVRSLAHELAPRAIRVNSVHPAGGPADPAVPAPPGSLVFDPAADTPEPSVATGDVSGTVVYLTSDDARLLTGLTVPVDAGLVPR